MNLLDGHDILILFIGFLLGFGASFLAWRLVVTLKPELLVSKNILHKEDTGLIYIRNNNTKRKIVNLKFNITVVDKHGNCNKVNFRPPELLALKKKNIYNKTQALTDNFKITIFDFNNIFKNLNNNVVELTASYTDSLSNVTETTNVSYTLANITIDKAKFLGELK
jgi:hypothetical protein